MRRRRKGLPKIIALGLFATLLVCTPVSTLAAHSEDKAVEHHTGLQMEGYELPLSEVVEEEAITYRESLKKAHSGATSEYAKYTNDYFYNQMNSNEQAFYSALYNVCDELLTGNDDVTNKYNNKYYTTTVQYSSYGLSQEQAENIFWICTHCNPQFYFLDGAYVYSNRGGYIAYTIYDDFASGANRTTATQNLMNAVSQYMSYIDAQSTKYDKIKKAHDLLCVNVSYQEDSPYDQSCYSTFAKGKTVCAGYAEAFELLMNAAGITTVALTSTGHEWNAVWLDGNWYAMDVTWDDQDWGIMYDYFLKSDATIQAEDYDNHQLESLYAAYNPPVCLYDYGQAPTSGGSDPGAVAGSYSGQGTVTGNNIVSVNEAEGTVVVNDGVTGSTAVLPTEYTTEGKAYRMYDPSRGEHFYTKNTAEMNSLVQSGWIHEENADFTVVSASDSDAIPVYRLYNPNDGGMHFYTENASEASSLASSGWSYEGISHYVYAKDSGKGSPQYRLYNPNSTNGEHNWTADSSEKDMLMEAGWQLEGIAWEIK